jgi:hypothetical protein
MISDGISNIFDTYWSLKFALLPHRCIKSNKWIWLTLAYRGETLIRYDIERFNRITWMSKQEFLFYELRGLE